MSNKPNNQDQSRTEVNRSFASARDTTERKQLEAVRQKALDRFQKITQLVPGIIYQFRLCPDGSTCIPYASEATRKIYRLNPEEIREDASKAFTHVHPDDLESLMASIQASARDLTPWQHEYRLKFDDGTCWLFGNGLPQREADGSTLWHGFITDITERKQLEQQLSRRLRHRNVMERITQISLNSASIEELLGRVLDEMLTVFNADRAYFLYPCDPDAPSWSVPMERTRPEWPGAFARGMVIPMTPEAGDVFRELLASTKPLPYGHAASRCIPAAAAEQFSIRSMIQIALRPRVGSPWVMGLHHCAQARAYDEDDLLIFGDIGRRVADALSSMIILKNLRESEQRFSQLAENIREAFWLGTPDWNDVLYISPAYEKIWGRSCESLYARPLDWLDAVVDADREQVINAISRKSAGDLSNVTFPDYRILRPDGSERWIRARAFPVRDAEEKVYRIAGIAEDITERKQAEEKIYQLAFYDLLTGLPNRRLLNDRLGQTLAASKRSGRYGALMFMDLDNFKPLNDAHGHSVGDLLLMEVARRITSCVREVDTVARFGGDEFVVILSELDADKTESLAQTSIVAEKIRAILAEPYLLTIPQEGKAETITAEHLCTSSIGVVLFISYETSAENILKWADMAMYQAKEGGRNLIRFFDS